MNPINTIVEDSRVLPIICTTRRGNGKTTTIKAIVDQIRKQHPETIFKVFDMSMAWLENAPLKYRQVVSAESILNDTTKNIGDCAYILNLDDNDKISFIASIIKSDLNERKALALTFGLDVVDSLPWIIYIVEEVNEIFSSGALRGKNPTAQGLREFLSIGRNFNTNLIGITTASSGEVSPKLRRKAEYLCGVLNSASDINEIRKVEGYDYLEKVQALGKYEYLYSNNPTQVIKLAKVPTYPDPQYYSTPPKPNNTVRNNQLIEYATTAICLLLALYPLWFILTL